MNLRCPFAQNCTEKIKHYLRNGFLKIFKDYPQNYNILGVLLDNFLLYTKTIDVSLTIEKKNFSKIFYNVPTVKILSKAHKITFISSKKSHVESENLPKPFSIAPTCAPEFFFGCHKKCP